MTAIAIVTGTLTRDSTSGQSKTGTAYTSASVKVREGSTSRFWRVTAFDEAPREALAGMKAGSIISAQGLLRAEIYQPPGAEPRVSLSLVADAILNGKGKPRAPGQFRPKTSSSSNVVSIERKERPIIDDSLNDEVPW